MHVFRWDLDKTYLETDFDSLRGLVRSATEGASDKRAVPGATALMQAICRDGANRIFIVSGSPTQMRGVLKKKLKLDGVRYDKLILKDNLGNLKRGRIRAIKGQFGYKLPMLLAGRVGMGSALRETCFGDDAEQDAIVYSVYADAIAGRLSPAQVSRIMEAAGSYPDRIELALDALSQISCHDVVDRIFIRLDRGEPANKFEPLGSRVIPVHSWWQAALVMLDQGHITTADAALVLTSVVERDGMDSWAVAGLTQDIVRRGHVPPDLIHRLDGDTPALAACRQAVQRLGDLVPPRPSSLLERPDYVSLVRAWSSH